MILDDTAVGNFRVCVHEYIVFFISQYWAELVRSPLLASLNVLDIDICCRSWILVGMRAIRFRCWQVFELLVRYCVQRTRVCCSSAWLAVKARHKLDKSLFVACALCCYRTVLLLLHVDPTERLLYMTFISDLFHEAAHCKKSWNGIQYFTVRKCLTGLRVRHF